MFVFTLKMKQIKLKKKLFKRTRVFAGTLALILTTSLLTACAKTDGGGMIVAGSTSVQPYAEVLAEEYMVINPECPIDIQGGGSSAGITAAKAKSADIGMSSRSLHEDELGLWQIEIAMDGLVLIVNPDNTIGNLSLNQIRGVYAGDITQWSQLGGGGSEIHLIAREEGSGTRDAFTELVMGDMEITPKAIVQDSNGSVMQLVSGDPNAIGFISLGLVNDQVKALDLDGVEASGENIMNGTYTLARPFLFVAKDEPTGRAKSFVDFVLSLEGQKILKDEGLISILEEVN